MNKQAIFITSQKGVNSQYNKWAIEALEDFMKPFADYNKYYEITDLSNWKNEDNYFTSKIDFQRLETQKRQGYVKLISGDYLTPYQSTDWYIAKSKFDAKREGYGNGLISNCFFDLMEGDTTIKQIPQLLITIVRDDLYTKNQGVNYILGHGSPDKGAVLSVSNIDRIEDINLKKEMFKTLVMHEFGHVCCSSFSGRKRSDGVHCLHDDCFMKSINSLSDLLKETKNRLKRNDDRKTPMCSECTASSNVYFAQKSQDRQNVQNAANLFNNVKRYFDER